MTMWSLCRRVGGIAAIALSAAGGLGAQGVEDAAAPVPQFGGEPTEIAYTVKPELLNRPEVAFELEHSYPASLRRAGVGGRVGLWLLIDEAGEIMSARVRSPSGVPALDAAALKVGSAMRFSPAKKDGSPVKVWIQLPVVFAVQPADPSSAGPRRENPMGFETPGRYVEATPPPPSSAPELLNRAYVFRQLKTAYDRRFGTEAPRGTTTLRLHIDLGGNATAAEIERSSGSPALDSLALAMRPMLVFVPAIQGGLYAEGSIKLPLRFPPKEP